MFNRSLFYLVTWCLIFFGTHSLLAQEQIIRNDTTFIIDNIYISGNKHTKAKIILREIELKRGDTVYLQQLLNGIKKSKQNLINRSLFNTVNITPKRHDFNKVDLYVTVTERWYIWPIPILTYADRNINVWWETKDFSHLNYGVNLRIYNFRGRMETLNVILQGGFDKALGFNWQIPYINKKQKWGLEAYAQATFNHSIDYQLQKDKLVYYRQEKAYVKKWYSAKLTATFRPKYYFMHRFTMGYDHYQYADTLLKLNPQFAYSQPKFSYLSLEYNFKYDFRDYAPYPLHGFYAEADVKQYGLGVFSKEVNLFRLYLIFDQYIRLHKRWYFAYSLSTQIIPNKYQPYFIQNGLGYDPMGIRGYQLYVVRGNWIGQLRSNFKFAIVPKKSFVLSFIKTEKFNRFFFGLYANVFFDGAYVNDNAVQKNGNFLNNKFLYGTGVGLDFVTFYDIVVRAEYVFNRNREHHFFISFVAPI
jgi:outer membrane protein assembly factor BamA